MPAVVIDIETVPSQIDWVRDELSAGIRPPGTLKKEDSIAAWERDEKPKAVEKAWLKTSLDGALGQIVAIGYAVDNEPVQVLSVRDLSRSSEIRVLYYFFDAMKKVHAGTSGRAPTLVGHNVVSFDLNFIWKRAVVLGVQPPLWWPVDPKPWSEHVYDTMIRFAGVGNDISLDRLCRVLGIDGKGDGPTGADVWKMVQEGRFDDVAEYCRKDVYRTRDVYQRMTFTVNMETM